MERADLRRLPWPELTLIACGLIFVLALMVRSSTDACHQWKEQLTRVTGAFFGAAGAEEYPKPGGGVVQDRAALRNAARRLLDERPFGCL